MFFSVKGVVPASTPSPADTVGGVRENGDERDNEAHGLGQKSISEEEEERERQAELAELMQMMEQMAHAEQATGAEGARA